MTESELHKHIFARSAALTERFSSVLVGPGDDCAVIATDRGDQLLLKVDQLVEHRHFKAHTPIDQIARKAIARTISDIAAMGGTPGWSLATCVLPPRYPHANDLFDRMQHWASELGAPLVGGDIATGPALPPPGMPLCLTVTVIGSPAPGRGPVLRSTARAGDEVWVTGKIGGSFVSGRHLTFTPRIREGRWLCDTLGPDLHAMMDISDGLGRDAGRIALASKVKIVIEGGRVPLNADAKDLHSAVEDGEDYELLFTAAPGSLRPDIMSVGLAPMTRIGRVEAGSGCALEMPDGRVLDASQMGWDH